MDKVKEGDKESLSGVLEEIMYYGFSDEAKLCEMLQIEDSELDSLMSDSSEITNTEYKQYKSRLNKLLKAEKSQYERLYYKQNKPAVT